MILKRKRFNLDRPKSFTLIELLIVIGIIAIIAAAVIIAINPGKQFQQARNAARWSHLNAIANGVYGYVIDNGTWPSGCPPTCTGVSTGGPCASTTCPFATVTTACTALVPTYLPSIPVDPQTRSSYRIRFYNSSQNRMQICPPTDATDSNLPELVQ